jgi:hypothetical protein
MPSFKILVPLYFLFASACISLPDIEPEGPKTPPTITESTQSATAVLGGDTITFHITAEDAQDSQLRFAWTASTGTLGSPSSTGLASEVTWTAPLCVPAGTLITVTITVTNDAELSASKSFTLSANACPAPSVAAGRDHSLALRGDGTVWTWGGNSGGQLGDGTAIDRFAPVQVAGLTDVTAIVGSGSHSLALRSDGTLWAWGTSSRGQLGDGTTARRLAPVKSLLP